MQALDEIVHDSGNALRDDDVICVSHVYKRYRYGAYNLSLRHEARSVLQRVFGQSTRKSDQPVYALQDINFTVKRGEAVGIIGRNGAGKTTLLRLLSGITQPTAGTIKVRGRFATLIGLNAGFNYDMSGRKNIYLNAAIFGVPPHETAELESEIIEFADIGPFIDMPVKLYSSGMLARLGFSIAIHIMPEIIFLDEVLAVGDAEFVHKCTERILNFKKEQRTIVLVSHSAQWVEMLCDRVIWLNQGMLVADGPTETVLYAYKDSVNA
jgi:ABC-type polysaccharide/polyol phosphate transport system ATPase subunit